VGKAKKGSILKRVSRPLKVQGKKKSYGWHEEFKRHVKKVLSRGEHKLGGKGQKSCGGKLRLEGGRGKGKSVSRNRGGMSAEHAGRSAAIEEEERESCITKRVKGMVGGMLWGRK